MWITSDQAACSRQPGPLNICGDSACRQKRKLVGQWPSPNACYGYPSGVWVQNGCGSTYSDPG